MANYLDKLKSFFNFTIITPDKGGQEIPYPAHTDPETKKLKKLKMTPELEELYKYWLTNNFDNSQSIKNRMDRYKDIDYMIYNNAIMSMVADMYADETVQADSQREILNVYAENQKLQTYITDFFQSIGINQTLLREASYDSACYGDHFWMNSFNEKEGIIKVTPIDKYTLTDRLEYNASRVKEELNKQAIGRLTSNYSALEKLKTYMNNSKTDYSLYFMSYLFGFQIGEDIVVPPWYITHFRRTSSRSEFWPFGRSLLINCISPYRQYQSIKNLMALILANSFPREHFQVETSEHMTEAEKWDAVNQAREEYHNLGISQTTKEHFAVGGQIWTPKDLIDYELQENNYSNINSDVAELHRDELIMGTRIPKGYLIVDRASFGTSGQALLQQFKPFGRAVFSNQSTILEGLIYLVQLQFLLTGAFPVDSDFEINMNFPVIEESSDRLRTKSDSLRLASDIVLNIQTALGLGRDEALPPEIVKQIFSKYSFLDSEDLNSWIESMKSGDSTTDSEEEGRKTFYDKKTIKKINERLNDDIIRKSYFNSKNKLSLKEGVQQGRHYMASKNVLDSNKLLFSCMEKNGIEGKKLKG